MVFYSWNVKTKIFGCFSRFKMPGFLKATLTVPQAVDLTSKFTAISVDSLLSPDATTPRLSKISLKFVYIAQPQKKLVFSKFSKAFNQARKLEMERYHRYIVLGVPGTPTVLTMFTQTSEETRRLLRYQKEIRPGSEVVVLKPNLEGTLAGGSTPLITTREPLIPVTANNLICLQPYDVEGTSLEYKFFSFVTKGLHVDSVVIAENVCDGTLCDGHTFHEPCGCVEASTKKTWGLLIEFRCPEFHGLDENISLYSVQIASVFLTNEVRTYKADSDRIDRFDLDEQAQKIVDAINQVQGFRIEGWFKPAADDEGTALGNKRYHVSLLTPDKELTTEQAALKYNGVTDSSPSTSAPTLAVAASPSA